MAEFDMSVVQQGARLRRSPFYEATQRYGPLGFTVYNHMLFPIRFADLEAEYWHLLRHVSLWDVAVERNLEISGPDALRFAQLMTPRDLSACAVGQARYVLITALDGGILNDPVMLRLDEDRFWFSLASSDVMFYAMGLAAHAGLDVRIGEADAAPLQVQGPRSRELVGDLFGDEAAGLGYYRFTRASADGIPVIVTRTGWTGELGYEVYLLDPARGTDLWEQIMRAGRSYQLRPAGPSDIRRVEAGILNWGADMTYENNPYEVGLGRLVDLDSGADFLARPALTRIRDHGVRRRLAGVQIDGPRLAMNTTKWPVRSGADRVGKVTSALYSPRLECNIGYAWVPAELAEPGTQLLVDTEAGGERPATVVPVPFIDPGKQTPKA